MSEAVDPVLEALSNQKASFNYVYLGKFGKYRLEVQGMKMNKGKAICEFIVRSSEKTHPEIDPHPVGEVVSYVEDVLDDRKGGGGRFNGMLLRLVDEQNKNVTKRLPWLSQFFKADVQAGTYLAIGCEVKPRNVEAKGDKPAFVARSESWSSIDLTEAEQADVDARRTAAKLPPLAKVIEILTAIKEQG